MRTTTRTFIGTAIVLGLVLAARGGQPDSVVWVDFDFKSIPEPKTRSVGYYDSFFSSEFAERWKRGTDIARGVRLAVGAPKEASNVNALDEVPDSSWYTNRHALRRMTIDELARGPNRGAPPDLTHATITKAKLEGVTPGLQLTDKNGQNYLIKFDNKNYPELQSGAEVISTKILYAAGFNVPENYVAYLDPANLEIKAGVQIASGKSKRLFTREDLTRMLQNAAKRPDGSYRVLASKILKGVSKGPFSYVEMRSDDPNDLIPHEHRRELRGLRVIASWINHWDLKEMNTLDMYVEEGGRKFLRHFLIDFGSSLGAGKTPSEYFHGKEYAYDTASMFKELLTLGIYVTADEQNVDIVSPEVGLFSAGDFDPGDWKPSFHVLPFDNMTREDAFWAARIALSFTEDELVGIVKTGQYSNPKAADYILRTLLERRQRLASHWLKDVNPIADFSLEAGEEGIELKFSDLLAEHDLAASAQYRYEVSQVVNGERRIEKGSGPTPHILLGRALNGETRIKIWTIRDGRSSNAVTVDVHNKPGGHGIFRIERS